MKAVEKRISTLLEVNIARFIGPFLVYWTRSGLFYFILSEMWSKSGLSRIVDVSRFISSGMKCGRILACLVFTRLRQNLI